MTKKEISDNVKWLHRDLYGKYENEVKQLFGSCYEEDKKLIHVTAVYRLNYKKGRVNSIEYVKELL